MESLVLANVLTLLVAVCGTALRYVIRKRMDLLDWFVVSVGVFNGGGTALVLLAQLKGYSQPFLESLSRSDLGDLVYYSYFCWVLLGTLWLGGVVGGRVLLLRKQTPQGPRKEGVERAPLMFSTRNINTLGWLMLVLAVFTYWLYSRAYGGFAGLLKWSYYIRSGLFDYVPRNPWSFLRPFGSFSMFSALLFWSVISGSRTAKRRQRSWIGFVLAFSFSLYVLVSYRGRLGLVMYLLIFPASRLLAKTGGRVNVRSCVHLVLIVLVASSMLLVSDSVLGTGKGAASAIEFFAKELAFPLRAFSTFFANPEYSYLKDIAVIPLLFMPERLRGAWYETPSQRITTAIAGVPRGVDGVTAGIPTDIITFGLMQLGIFGVVVVGIALGWVLTRLEAWFRRLPMNPESVAVFYTAACFQLVTLSSLYAEPSHIINRGFALIVGLVLMQFSISGLVCRVGAGLVDQGGARDRRTSPVGGL